jgi:hypothetical protein
MVEKSTEDALLTITGVAMGIGLLWAAVRAMFGSKKKK